MVLANKIKRGIHLLLRKAFSVYHFLQKQQRDIIKYLHEIRKRVCALNTILFEYSKLYSSNRKSIFFKVNSLVIFYVVLFENLRA